MYGLIFVATFFVLIVFQLGMDRINFAKLGTCELKIDSPVEKMDVWTLIFRTSLCVLVAFYFIGRNGNDFAYNILFLTIILGAMASKIFFPVITLLFFSDACGVYQNGIVTLCGTKRYGSVMSYAVQTRDKYEVGSNRFMFVFRSRYPYVSRPSFVYVNKNHCSRVEKLLSDKHHVSKK